MWRVEGPDFVAGCGSWQRLIVEAAPILAWAIGRSVDVLWVYCRNRRMGLEMWRPGLFAGRRVILTLAPDQGGAALRRLAVDGLVGGVVARDRVEHG